MLFFQETGFRRRKPPWLTAEEMGRLRDKAVTCCTDVAAVSPDRKLLLARRSIHPFKGEWWFIGGGMDPGEREDEACAKHVARDAGLAIRPDRFLYLDRLQSVFAWRQEPPQENGSHTCNFTYAIQLTHEEATQIRLSPAEYDDRRWFTADDVEAEVSAGRIPEPMAAFVRLLREKGLV